MNIRSKKLLFAGASSLCFCLLIFSTPVAASETDEAAEPVKAAVTDTQANREKADKKQEDMLDRVFSPLDNAVSDINRDLNKGDGSAAPESNE